MTFDQAPAPLARALAARGYTPTPVQAALLDPELGTRDLVVQARTGSGKTIGFGLLLAPALLDQTFAPKQPRALVVAPTRELAQQVQRELSWLYAEAGVKVAAAVGGTDLERQIRELRAGVGVLVGTPGRLRDLLERRSLDLSATGVVVLDEADEMLDLGFEEELEVLLKASPVERRTLMFSATMPPGAKSLAARWQREARTVALVGGEAHADISYRICHVGTTQREAALVNLLRALDPPSALIFAATREGAATLQARLAERGFSAVLLSGELSQAERNRALSALRDRRARLLVATDVAARGLDLPALDLVVHYDLPHDEAALLHRSGRTGRAGRKGTSVLLVPASRRRAVTQMLERGRIRAEKLDVPTPADILALEQARLVQDLAPAEDAAEADLAVARALLERYPPEQLLAGLVRSRREQWPAAEEVPMGPPVLTPTRRGGVWFRVNLGYDRQANPARLLPLLCRRGKVGREAIGTIKIGRRESRFEVHPDAADTFEANSAQTQPEHPDIHIARLEDR